MFAIKFSITLEIFEGVMVLGHLMHLYWNKRNYFPEDFVFGCYELYGLFQTAELPIILAT
jgi:hypothetical protein